MNKDSTFQAEHEQEYAAARRKVEAGIVSLSGATKYSAAALVPDFHPFPSSPSGGPARLACRWRCRRTPIANPT